MPGKPLKKLDLELKTKCFPLKVGGKIKSKYYADIKGSVFIVAGGELDMSKLKMPPVFANEQHCSRVSKGVILYDDGHVKLSSYIDTDTIYCPNSSADGKVYWLFGHER